MLEKLMRLYVMSMMNDVRSPMPHVVGPPGCGKSTYVEQLADLLEVELHVINVSRLSPLDVEGVQMPHGSDEDMHLRMLPATFWTSLKEGDILLMDEFLRGFPEVFNALLDIFTSRRVGAFRLPKVFIIGASNSVISYDSALEDRLMHLPVPDPRHDRTERLRLGKLLIDVLGLNPGMSKTSVMQDLFDEVILPTYNILDSFHANNKGQTVLANGNTFTGASLRNLIGQVQLRVVQTPQLRDMIAENNRRSLAEKKFQYLVLLGAAGEMSSEDYRKHILPIRDNPKLAPIQKRNIECNLQILDLEAARKEEA